MNLRLLLIGFGTVGQGLAELLLEKRDEIGTAGGPDISVVGIADFLKGSVYNAAGLDLAHGCVDLQHVDMSGLVTDCNAFAAGRDCRDRMPECTPELVPRRDIGGRGTRKGRGRRRRGPEPRDTGARRGHQPTAAGTSTNRKHGTIG